MRIDRAALPFVLIATLPFAAAWWLVGAGWASPLLALPIAIGLFFRDPDRTAPNGHDVVVSPADGRVMHVGPADPATSPPGVWQQFTLFLSPLDGHINRTPVAGRVTQVKYHPGSFLPAYRHDSAMNERSEIWFDHDGQTVVARQVVGMMARRVVCRLTVGQQVAAGDRLGLMKFGSRMDVFLPTSAVLLVSKDQYVRGAETIVARLGE
jgi:phosphatidylserine decarboxylase